SACSLPPYTLSQEVQEEMKEVVKAMGLELGVVGLMNVQLAYQDGLIYVIEVNPRASRTVPFVSKAIGTSLAKVAARCMAGKTLAEAGFTEEVVPKHFSVKESV
ncbi:ATP-grasp domain-containing protein, partial [Oleiphilus sp. HI0117]